MSINGVTYATASNTVSNLIPGVTFQLLGESSSGSQVQVVIANDNSGVESAVNQFVSDYNSLISAVNTQEGNDSSGNPEPLFGSPTLSLLQQELLGSLTTQSPNGALDAISSVAGVTLSGSMTIQAGSGTAYTFQVGDGSSSGDTYYTGSGNNTLADLASTINSANIGVTAGISTSNGESTLTLTSQTAGSNGALAVTSAIAGRDAHRAQLYRRRLYQRRLPTAERWDRRRAAPTRWPIRSPFRWAAAARKPSP